MRLASVTLAASLLLLTAAAIAPTASAVGEPVGDCVEDGSVADVCFPVCIQAPCYPYVCVKVDGSEHCIRP